MTLANKRRAQGKKDRQSALMARSFEHEAVSWDALLTNQVSVYFDSEVEYLARLPEWRDARSVLDVGCGNGDFLARLNAVFPKKKYAGIDLSAALIDIANDRHRNSNLTFKKVDIQQETWSRRADVVLLRFVCQHLADPGNFFTALRRNCKRASHVIVAEPSFADSRVFPELPELTQLIEHYEKLCRGLKNARSAVSRGNLSDLCGPDWRVADVTTIHAQVRSRAATREQLAMMFDGWVTAIEQTQALSADFPAVREALRRWLMRDDARAHLALKYWLLSPARVPEHV